MQEFQPLPERRDALEQDALARLRRLRADQVRRGAQHFVAAGEEGHAGRAKQRGEQRNAEERGVVQADEAGNLVQHAVGDPDDVGEEPAAAEVADQAAGGRGAAGVQHVFRADRGAAVAERAQRADLRPLVVDHAGHRGRADERGDQEEEDREDRGELLDDLRIAFKRDVAGVALSRENVQVRRLERREVILRVVDFRLGVGNLGLKFLKAVLVVLEAVLVFGAALLEGLHALLVGGDAAAVRRDAVLKLDERAVGRVELRLLFSLLLLERHEAAVVLRPAVVELRARGGQLGFGSVQLGLRSVELFLFSREHRAVVVQLGLARFQRRGGLLERDARRLELRLRFGGGFGRQRVLYGVEFGAGRLILLQGRRVVGVILVVRVDRGAVLRPAVLPERDVAVVPGFAGVELRLAGFVRRLGSLELRARLLERLPARCDRAVELVLPVVILRPARVQRILPGGEARLELFGARVELGGRVVELRLRVRKLGLAVGDFLRGVVKLCLRVVELGLRRSPLLAQLRFGVGDLLLAVGDEVVKARLDRNDGVAFHGVRERVDVVLVFVAVQLEIAAAFDVQLGEVFGVEALGRDQHKGVEAAVAERRGAALDADVQRRAGEARDRVFLVGENVVLIGLGDRDLPADHVLGEAPGVGEALVAARGQAAGREHRLVDAVRQHVRAVDGLRLAVPRDEVRVGGARGGRHALDGRDRRNVRVVEADRREQAQVVQGRVVYVFGRRRGHHGAGDPQAGQECDAQHDDEQNREIAPEAAGDAAPDILFKCLSHRKPPRLVYHSISSTGVMCSFMRMEWIVPLLTRMIRSAMPESAALCVMITTVMPSRRQVSCRSFRIDLPVS